MASQRPDEEQLHIQHVILEQTYGGDLYAFWLRVFGDHYHHGYYENHHHMQLDTTASVNDESASLAREAAVRLIDKLLIWADISDDGRFGAGKILDVGMGLGAVSRYFATKFAKASVQGISLAKVEVEIATKLAASQNLTNRVSFMVADALALPFPDNVYDLVWCLECADHISDRKQLMKELARVTTPGGRIVLATMCSRELLLHETSLGESEKESLRNIFSDDLAVAPWSPPSLYVKLAHELGLEDIRNDNWTKHVTPGVPIWAHFYQNSGLAESVAAIKEFSRALPALQKGYDQGLVQYFVFTARKPFSSSSAFRCCSSINQIERLN